MLTHEEQAIFDDIEKSNTAPDAIAHYRSLDPAHQIDVPIAFWLWGYQIAYNENNAPPHAQQLVVIYKKLIPIWNDVSFALKNDFDQPECFYYTYWHYELLKSRYHSKDISGILRTLRAHRHDFLNNSVSKDKFTEYRAVLNANQTLRSLIKDPTQHAKILSLIEKKWHGKRTYLSESTANMLEGLGLLDSLQTYADAEIMFECFENIYFSKENEDDFLLNYFSPHNNVLRVAEAISKDFKLSIPNGYLDFVKEKKNALSRKQYRALFEYDLLFPEQDVFSDPNPAARADAFSYAYNCWQDNIEVIMGDEKSTTPHKNYRLKCMKEDDIKSYCDLYYKCCTDPWSIKLAADYLQRLVNWVCDQIRWCYHHPGKAFALLIITVALTVIFEMFTPILAAVQAGANHFSWHTPAWLSFIGSAGSVTGSKMAAVRGLGWLAAKGKTNLFIHMANNKAQGTIRQLVHLDKNNVSSLIDSLRTANTVYRL